MAQTNFTPISLYYSSTAGNAPLAANLVNGELALNIADGKLFYKNSSGVVAQLGGNPGGANTQVQFNNSGAFAGDTDFTFDGTGPTAGYFIPSGSGVPTNGMYLPATNTVGFSTASTNAMVINATQNVGIGTATPGAKLTVAGTGYSPNITLADAATIAWNTALGQVATFTFTGTNRAVGAPTNLVNGGFYGLAVIQSTGNNTLTWNAVFKFPGGTAPTLSTAAGAQDYFVFRSDGTNMYLQGSSLGVA